MARSKARAALDSWLAAAEGLLYEQRSRSISPSSYTGSWSDGVHESTSTVREVGAGLEDLLRQLTQAPGRWIFVIRDARTPAHYIQFLSYEDGSFLAEVVSNYFLDQLQDTRPRWDEAQEKKLAALGWQAPAPTWLPNWTEIWPVYAPKVDVVAARGAPDPCGGLRVERRRCRRRENVQFSESRKNTGERGCRPVRSRERR